ncbi:MAG: thioredoxin family protein [Roseibium sp.]|nr:thioredoxin family protein [Roseibium sp.]
MIIRCFAGLFAVLMVISGAVAEDRLPEPELSDSGLHVQPWFHDGFLELADDLSEAAESGKDLLILVEQPGCPYCRELHHVNLRIPKIADYMRDNYLVVQLDMRGSREAADLDGTAMEERDLVRRWGVTFTPTLLFVPAEAAEAGGTVRDHAAMTMPGYFKPFHFETMLHFVASDAYAGGDFQRYLDQRAADLREKGEEVDIW